MPCVTEEYFKDGSFTSGFEGTSHSFSGHYTFDTTITPHLLDMEVRYSTLEKLPPGIYKSIFEITNDGNEYISTSSVPGKARPKDFSLYKISAKKVKEK
jgi:hypothetical protein